MKRTIIILVGAHIAAMLIAKAIDYFWSGCPDEDVKDIVESVIELEVI